MNSFSHAALAAAAIALALTTSVPALADDISIVLGSEPTTLDPHLTEDSSERAVNDNIYETLMKRLPDGTLVPGLAAAAPEQVDETTWRFTLRDGISFTNGEPLDSKAVAFSVERIIDPEYNSAQMSYFASISGVEAVDPLTVDVFTDGPDPILPSRLYWLKIVPPGAASEDGFARAPVGTGPYMFSDWTAGTSVTLERNPDYWGDAPSIEEVTFRYVPETGTQLAGLLAGEFDLMVRLPPESFNRAPVAKSVQGLEQPTIVLSAVSGITQDLRVRKALNYAIDKEAIAEALFDGYATVSQGQLLVPSYFGFDPDTQAYPYDPEKARALLEEAGVIGETIHLVGSNDFWLKDGETTEAVAGMWSAVGLNVDAQITPFSEYLPHVYDREHRVDALYVSNSNDLMDADRPLSAYYAASGPGSSNADEQMDAMIIAARRETDPETRAALYADIVSHANEQAYLAWLVVINDIYGMSEQLEWDPRVDAKLMVSEMTLAE